HCSVGRCEKRDTYIPLWCGSQYDLRVIDSAQAGAGSTDIRSRGRVRESIAGCVWRCVHCLRYYLCTPCYMKDRHSVWQPFHEIDSPENPRQRTRVRCRYQSGVVWGQGVCGSEWCVRDWRVSDQDGGAGREGTVVEVCGWQRRAQEVWQCGVERIRSEEKYRLGHKGKVDLQCTVAAEGGHCYLDHLPLLGSKYKPSTPFICAGDRVLLEADLLNSSQEEIGVSDITVYEMLGQVGLIHRVNVDEDKTKLFFRGHGVGIIVAAKALKRVEGPDILPDDVVRVIDDMAEVHRLQKDGRGWHDDMVLSLGQLGRVERFLNDGTAVVVVNGKRWAFNPLCVTSAPGEQPEDEGTEVEPEVGIEMLMVSVLKEPTQDLLFKLVAVGNSQVLDDVLKKSPDKVNQMYEGRTLLHVAAAEGRIPTTRVLLEYKADLNSRDRAGETPLHAATHYNRYQVAKLLLEEGSDVNARSSVQNTPVHVATAWGHSRLLALYLSHPKCLVDPQNVLGSTPLCISSQCYRVNITRQLLEAGADPTLICMKDVNAFLFAACKEYFSGVEVYLQYHQGLMNHAKVDDGYTSLHVAASMDCCDHLCYLAATSTCDLEKKSYQGFTALHSASIEGNIRSIECLVGYGADAGAADTDGVTSLHLLLAKRNLKPLSEWTPYFNKFHEYVLGADNRIQDVPVFITVACFLVSEGASLETTSVEGITPLHVCPPEYESLLQLFARPERRGNYRGSLPRHPPPVSTRHIQTQAMSDSRSKVAKASVEKTTPTTGSEATPPEVSVSGGDSNKREESEVDSVTGPSCFLCEGPCDISFQPCGHTAMCAECVQSVSVKSCPICKV
ncbi:E3 ubiquitin-protein ligase MIB2, partial [Geodia barretti]